MERSYSDILKSERSIQGIDLAEMSRSLHIRPDILNAIENADFDRMPARGYAKNMVRAYARALGLDEEILTDMFLDEIHYYEVGSPRASRSSRQTGDSRKSQSVSSRKSSAPSRSATRDSASKRRFAPSGANDSAKMGSRTNSSGRSKVHASSNSRKNLGSSNSRSVSDGRGEQTSRSLNSSRRGSDGRASSGRVRSNGRTSTQNRSSRSNRKAESPRGKAIALPSLFQGFSRQDSKVPRNFDTIGSTPPYARNTNTTSSFQGLNMALILAIVAAVIVVIIVAVVVMNGTKQSSEDVPTIPISGLTDTSNPQTNQTSSSAASLVIPTQVTFEYSVSEGKSTWLEVYENGDSNPSVAKIADGPTRQVFEVTDTLEFRTPNPDAVECKLDGADVELKASSNGEYTYTVSFADYLAKWKADHGVTSSSSSSSAISASSAASTNTTTSTA